MIVSLPGSLLLLAVAVGNQIEPHGPVVSLRSLAEADLKEERPRNVDPSAATLGSAVGHPAVTPSSTTMIGAASQEIPPASGDPGTKSAPSEAIGDTVQPVQPSVSPTDQTLPPSDPAAVEENGQEIVVTAKRGDRPNDPLRSVNEISYKITDEVDKAIVGPAAKAYKHVMPKPARKGLRNFLNNLREPIVFVNYLLQLKPGKAVETVGRFAINSTLGLGGVIDVAKRCPFNLPWRPNGFGDTLGVYGVKDGPYIFIPLIGPTTVRELVGGVVDRVASPIALGGPFKSRTYVVGTNAFRILDTRAEKEDEIEAERNSADPYAARRDRYLRDRKSRIDRLRGTGTPLEAIPEETREGVVQADDLKAEVAGPGEDPTSTPRRTKRRCKPD